MHKWRRLRDRTRFMTVLATTALTAALLIGAGLTSPANRALATPASAAGAAPPICSKSASGRLSACPPPLPHALLPAGARDGRPVRRPQGHLARLVDTRTWTSSGGNTFPGADVPFGMVQWSPDTMPHRSDGGGYTYGDRRLEGYSLTHLSGPGCRSAGDVPILPMTGALRLPGNPDAATTSFTNSGEIAQAGYYAARSDAPGAITSEFTATPHSALGRFTFPQGASPEFLIKLKDSERGHTASSATIISNHEVAGSDTSGQFCGETSAFGPQQYTLYFDITFSHSFTAHRVFFLRGSSDPNSVLLTFPRSAHVIEAHVAVSYVSTANARLDLRKEGAGWDFNRVRALAQGAWSTLLSRIEVSGGSYARTQEFYSLLCKDFLQPNVISDVNGEYRGPDGQVHQLAAGQRNQYGNFSGWDIYHSLAQLQAMLAPAAAGDMAQSLVNYYTQSGTLPQWAYVYLNNYSMIGDPADAVIADYYAFGARNFDTASALSAMLRQATTANRVRPGATVEARYGFLPYGLSYGCCNFRNPVSALLEYDTADFALSRFAAALGDQGGATAMQRQAGNWTHVFDSANHLLVPRRADGTFLRGVWRTTSAYYTEGDAVQYLWDVPNDYAGLFSRLGGRAAAARELRHYLSRPTAGGQYAMVTNEFDDGEQFAPDYAGDPATTQRTVAAIRTLVYRPGPDGIRNNDDLGAESSQFIWEMLGLYPENPGSGTLVFASPGFPRAVISLPNGKKITISAPGASPARFYVSSLKIDGRAYSRLYVPFATLARGSTMSWTLSRRPTSWGTAPADAPPSYGPS